MMFAFIVFLKFWKKCIPFPDSKNAAHNKVSLRKLINYVIQYMKANIVYSTEL